mmetsp:Transcript_42896/g.71335  ORF Transcript_42896/g.71335 Transcript_42896/m.71335 type:complete len:473 (+) Transcript_42896:36-1454(+)|eukprot:CAMPEP_0119318466 /NCGR_PEP_ID=MMETSP1333-20130426/46501_1 /TAXON_ID=418940 /ORGANISM="Scyphosphaera apsteinii, Strain RCC1455" /LENGTH=472 /DNA_ID=CAMNT_0007324643 /DNA_START=36 /DNA_END=1454 /DNA_ORIENTATION=+
MLNNPVLNFLFGWVRQPEEDDDVEAQSASDVASDVHATKLQASWRSFWARRKIYLTDQRMHQWSACCLDAGSNISACVLWPFITLYKVLCVGTFWQLSKPSPLWIIVSHKLKAGELVPEQYLRATFECFLLMCAVSWFLTLEFNPSVVEHNALKAVVGYNNICVGFDTLPARIFASPFQVLMAYCAFEYVKFDSLRARLSKKRGVVSKCRYQLTRWTNYAYGLLMICFPNLLILTPEGKFLEAHFFIFLGFVILSWLVVMANFVEAHPDDIELRDQVWFVVFTAFSVLLCVCGAADTMGYYAKIRAPPGTDESLKVGSYLASAFEQYNTTAYVPTLHPLLEQTVVATRRKMVPPTIPAFVMGFIDYGWFVLLVLSLSFFPDSPSIFVEYRLLTATEIDQSSVATKSQRNLANTILSVKSSLADRHERELAERFTRGLPTRPTIRGGYLPGESGDEDEIAAMNGGASAGRIEQ